MVKYVRNGGQSKLTSGWNFEQLSKCLENLQKIFVLLVLVADTYTQSDYFLLVWNPKD